MGGGRSRLSSGMGHTRLNWVVGGGIGALLFVAGVDAFRSSDGETSAPTPTAATTTVTGASALPDCTRQQLAVSIEARPFTETSSGRIAIIEVRSLNDSSCRLPGLPANVTIEDRAGNAIFQAGGPASRLSGAVLPASGQTAAFPISNDVPRCGRGGPYLALATLGPYAARRNFPGWTIGCPSVPESVNRLRAKYVARADAICSAATSRVRAALLTPGTKLTELQAWNKVAARVSEKALAKLRALPPPEPDRARVKLLLSFMERQTDVLRQAATAGDIARVESLSVERIRLTHRKDELVYRLAALWGASPDALYGCPVSLPA